MTPQSLVQNSKRIVIKIGSVLLTDEDTGTLKKDWLSSVIDDVAALMRDGKDIVIVSSGAIALGRKTMKLPTDIAPSTIPLDMRQAAAAAGQVILSATYAKEGARHDLTTALVLLTPRDIESQHTYLNAKATMTRLLEQKIIPIVNENDTVSTNEIRFGDNDRLAAHVGEIVGANLILQLSTTDGLYTGNPDEDPAANHIPVIESITPAHYDMAGECREGLSTGGMKSKLDAAKIANAAGIKMMIVSGLSLNPISKISRASIFTTNS